MVWLSVNCWHIYNKNAYFSCLYGCRLYFHTVDYSQFLCLLKIRWFFEMFFVTTKQIELLNLVTVPVPMRKKADDATLTTTFLCLKMELSEIATATMY